MIRPVRVGVVGMGDFGRLHARTLAGLAEAELVAVVARRQASLEAAESELPGVRGWVDLERALADSGAEAWVVASSTSTHVPLTRQILNAGLPALVEKPLAGSLAEALALAPLVREDSGNLMLGHILLFNTELRRLLVEVRSRPPLAYIDCARHRPVTTMERFPGESPFHLLMVHDLYVVVALADRREPRSFAASEHRSADGTCDLALGRLTWDDGLVASCTASFLTPEGMAEDGFDRMEVFGAGWAARVNANPRPLALWDDRARAPLTLEISTDGGVASGMLAEELRCFCRVVRKTQAVPVGATYRDALQVQGWLDRLERESRATAHGGNDNAD